MSLIKWANLHLFELDDKYLRRNFEKVFAIDIDKIVSNTYIHRLKTKKSDGRSLEACDI